MPELVLVISIPSSDTWIAGHCGGQAGSSAQPPKFLSGLMKKGSGLVANHWCRKQINSAGPCVPYIAFNRRTGPSQCHGGGKHERDKRSKIGIYVNMCRTSGGDIRSLPLFNLQNTSLALITHSCWSTLTLNGNFMLLSTDPSCVFKISDRCVCTWECKAVFLGDGFKRQDRFHVKAPKINWPSFKCTLNVIHVRWGFQLKHTLMWTHGTAELWNASLKELRLMSIQCTHLLIKRMGIAVCVCVLGPRKSLFMV